MEAVEHIVVLMLENRSFDHMLGYLYRDSGNVSPGGQLFEGLTGTESNPDVDGSPVRVFPITPDTPNAYFMPGADPGRGPVYGAAAAAGPSPRLRPQPSYFAANAQLFGTENAPDSRTAAGMQGFVTNYAAQLGRWGEGPWPDVTGTRPQDVMGCFTPEALPVLSALARGYAVCDHWFCSVPTETLPNRAFALAATSLGCMDDQLTVYTCPTIFDSLTAAEVSWKVYGYDAQPLTRRNFPGLADSPDANFGLFADFREDAADGTLASFVFLEPSWGPNGNSQHPNYDVALGEQLIHDVYAALRHGPDWDSTLLIITYDEHGGCYDHVPPPSGAVPPDGSAGGFGFDFTRLGPRVPTVLVSPLIAPGTVFRVPPGASALDHTSTLKTVEARWNLPPLTARDAAAEHVGAALTLSAPRTDDVLAEVAVPVSRRATATATMSATAGQRHVRARHTSVTPGMPAGDARLATRAS